jgi:short-subunit dehydrogenase
MEISGRRVLVTGASRGIGRAVAEGFAREGAQLALVARSAGPLEELAAELGGKAYPADLSDPGQVEGLVDRVEADGPVDVLVNNAGISNIGYVLDQKPDAIEALFRTNLLTPIHLCQQALPRMLERGRGHLVNMGSVAGVVTPPGLVHYGASKAGLAHYTAGLRLELKDLPVGLTLVQIGSTATDMDDATQAYPPYQRMRGKRSVEQVRFPIEDVVNGILDAVRRDRYSVVLPGYLRLLTTAVEIPRGFMRLVFRKISPRP